jgi:hypothetical protein
MSRVMGLSYIWVNLVLVNGETNAVILLWHYLEYTKAPFLGTYAKSA